MNSLTLGFYLSMQKNSASRVQRKSDSVDNLHIYQLVVEANNLTTAGTGKVWGTAMVWEQNLQRKALKYIKEKEGMRPGENWHKMSYCWKVLRKKYKTSQESDSSNLNPQTRKWFLNEPSFTKAH